MIAAKVASNCCVQLRAEAHWDQFKLVVGRARSLMVATTVGFVGVAGLIIISVWMQSVWICIVSVLMLMNCWRGLRQARVLSRLAESQRYDALACPSCNAAPPAGAYWICRQCRKSFDTFQTEAVCPYCAARFSVTACPECGGQYPMNKWIVLTVVVLTKNSVGHSHSKY